MLNPYSNQNSYQKINSLNTYNIKRNIKITNVSNFQIICLNNSKLIGLFNLKMNHVRRVIIKNKEMFNWLNKRPFNAKRKKSKRESKLTQKMNNVKMSNTLTRSKPIPMRIMLNMNNTMLNKAMTILTNKLTMADPSNRNSTPITNIMNRLMSSH